MLVNDEMAVDIRNGNGRMARRCFHGRNGQATVQAEADERMASVVDRQLGLALGSK